MPRLLTRFLLLVTVLALAGCDGTSEPAGTVETVDLVDGTGEFVLPGHTLAVTYVAMLEDGTVFDAVETSDDPFIFTLGVGMVIKGWDQGLPGMKEGGTRRLVIPAHLAFGRDGQCLSDGTCPVPPNTDIRCDITVEKILFESIVEDEVVGTGAEAVKGSDIAVHYVGRFLNDAVFDQSPNDQPFLFTLGAGEVIEGWDRGIVGMREGGVRHLTIPPHLAYGRYRTGPIPAYATLRFRVELVRVY